MAMAQEAGPDGVARTRWAVLRNTYAELETTTMKTWEDWLPEAKFGKISRQAPFTQTIKLDLKDKKVEMEIIFLALDRADQIGKLLSLELTGAWLNEAREFPKEILDAVTMRVGRYPAVRNGGPSWYGVIADTNAPDEEHWWAIMSGQSPPPEWMSPEEAKNFVLPNDWKFWSQAGAMKKIVKEGRVTGYEMNPDRENEKNIVEGYYEKQIEGKEQSWINVYILNQVGAVKKGQPIYPEYSPEVHRSKDHLRPIGTASLFCGLDFGLTPAAVFCQQHMGRWKILSELVTFNTGITEFSTQLASFIAEKGYSIENTIFVGDPAGDIRDSDKRTPINIMRRAGFNVRAAPSNEPTLRWEAVRGTLMQMRDGAPRFQLDPGCTHLHKGFMNDYVYDKKGKADKVKSTTSHVHDALQYALLGAGEGRGVGSHPGNKSGRSVPRVARKSWNVFGGRRHV